MCVPERAVPHGPLHSRVRGSVGSSGVFLTPLLPRASQWDTMTRQLLSHAGLVGLGRLALPFDLWGLIIARPAYVLLITDQGKGIKLKKGWGPWRSVLSLLVRVCTYRFFLAKVFVWSDVQLQRSRCELVEGRSELKAVLEEWDPSKDVQAQSGSWHGYHQTPHISVKWREWEKKKDKLKIGSHKKRD